MYSNLIEKAAEFHGGIPAIWQTVLQTLVVAIPVVLLVSWVGGQLYKRHRDGKDRSGNTDSIYDKASNSVKAQWWNKLHIPTFEIKNRYFEYIGRCGVILAGVFILLALELTLFRERADINKYFAMIDMVAIVFVLLYWWRSKVANQRWVSIRIQAELMRQWRKIKRLELSDSERIKSFDSAVAAIITDVLQPQSKFKKWLGLGPTSEELEKRIDDYWGDLRTNIQKAAEKKAPNEWLIRASRYVNDRPKKQLAWFDMRQKQLVGAGKSRGTKMIFLYVISLFFAFGNLIVAHNLITAFGLPSSIISWTDIWLTSDVLALCLLATTAISAAMTYWFISRNERSLKHRYKTQKRMIEKSILKMELAIKRNDVGELCEQILEFEDLMIDEMVDWVHITSHDVAELGG